MYDREDVSTKLLKQLSKLFGVPITYFFTDDKIYGNNTTESIKDPKDEKIAFLEKIILEKNTLIAEKDARMAEKDALIAEKERTIQLLGGKE